MPELISKVAGAILLTQSGNLVLQRRDNDPKISSPNMISVFGGHCESGETSFETMVREIAEETGLSVSENNSKLLLNMQISYENGNMREGSFYLVTGVEPKSLLITEGQMEIISPAKITDHFWQMVPMTCYVIAYYLQNIVPAENLAGNG